MNGATHHHTAHQLGLARVAYRFHPLFGYEVQVIRRVRPGVDSPVIVQGEEELRIMMPGWMLDEGYCQMLVVADQPQISVEALVRLRAVVDAQDLQAGGVNDEYAWLVENENSQESPTTGRKTVADAVPGNA